MAVQRFHKTGFLQKSKKPLGRIVVNMAGDGVMAAIAAPLARWLSAPQEGLLHPLWFLAGGVISLSMGGLPFRIFQQYWRFSGLADLMGIAGASVASAFLFTIGLYITGFPLPSVTFPIIHALVLLMLMGGIRVFYRLVTGWTPLNRQNYKKVLIVGADTSADLFVRAFKRRLQHPIKVSGILSLGKHQAGRRLHGTPILGHVSESGLHLKKLAQKGKLPEGIVITDSQFRGASLARLLSEAEKWNIPVERAPDMTELSPAARVELKPIAIEDLLNRLPVELDRNGMDAMIRGKMVLVTGAGGTIGSELARQIASLSPSMLLLLDNGEYALWKIDVELGEIAPHTARKIVVGDIRNAERMAQIFKQFQPELVFHAAALKHVPIVEANPAEGMMTNIVGTSIIANAASAWGAKVLVLISTDKAVNPSSLMGASKRAAEIYCQALDVKGRTEGDQGLRCITVRFGNVLGSTGSVVPLFSRQLKTGGPITVTHPDMQRYFMTVPEAVSLVLQASVRGSMAPQLGNATDQNLKNGGIFVLDMGEPVKIVNLARQMIRLAGLRPDEDIAITYTGLRPGEKLFEELFHGNEAPVPTDFAGLKMAIPRYADYDQIHGCIEGIAQACSVGNIELAIKILKEIVPEFLHNPYGDGPAPIADPSHSVIHEEKAIS